MIDRSIEDNRERGTQPTRPALKKIAADLALKLGRNPSKLSSQIAQAPKR